MTPEYPFSKDEVSILKAAWASDAGKLALTLIIERLGQLHGHSISADPIEHALIPGRRFVAVELARAINTPLDQFTKDTDDRSSSRPLTATERAARVTAGLDPAGRRRSASQSAGS